MRFKNFLIASLLTFSFIQCGSSKKTFQFTIEMEKENQKYQLGETVTAKIVTKDKRPITKVIYNFQGIDTEQQASIPFTVKLDNHLLGNHTLKATVFTKDGSFSSITNLTILNNKSPKVYSYEIIATYPHNTKHFTQGLEINNNTLYESAGHYGASKLLKKNLKTGETLIEHPFSKEYFAEGITIVNDKIHLLTWRKLIGFTFDLETLKPEGSFAYNQSKQGWGICYDGKNTIYKSDGTTKIWKLDAKTLEEKEAIQVATNKSIKSSFNELEWVNGKIYANTWQKDGIAIINPENGAIEGIINCKGLRKEVGISAKDNEKVLNGIAYDKDTDQLYVTGKYWKSLFEIKVVE